MINVKQLLCRHTFVPTSRKLITIYHKLDNEHDTSTVNVYLQKGYCAKCKKRFAKVIKIHDRLDRTQPYDK